MQATDADFAAAADLLRAGRVGVNTNMATFVRVGRGGDKHPVPVLHHLVKALTVAGDGSFRTMDYCLRRKCFVVLVWLCRCHCGTGTTRSILRNQ